MGGHRGGSCIGGRQSGGGGGNPQPQPPNPEQQENLSDGVKKSGTLTEY